MTVDELREIIRAEVRREMSRYHLESLSRMVSWAMHYHNTGQKTTVDAEKTLEHFLKLIG